MFDLPYRFLTVTHPARRNVCTALFTLRSLAPTSVAILSTPGHVTSSPLISRARDRSATHTAMGAIPMPDLISSTGTLAKGGSPVD